ncbi:ubiquitin-specific protease otu1 [Lecanora helva]
MRLRIRGPAGQSVVSLPESATVRDLHTQIVEKTSIAEFEVKYGYPPKSLTLNWDSTTKLSDLGVKLDGEQLIVSTSVAAINKSNLFIESRGRHPSGNKSAANGSASTPTSTLSSFSFANVGLPPSPQSHKPVSPSSKPASSSMDVPELALPSHSSTMILRIMPDDNSCLFRAFSTAFFGIGIDSMYELRSIIAQHIQSHADEYDAVVLERQPDDYCRWIQTEDAWGGAIELAILSRHFDIELCSIDVQSLRVDHFNQGRPTRCILVYSGIHYDAIALSPSNPPHERANAPPELDTKVFDAADPTILQGAVELCKILQGKHYYTDTAAFSVKCNLCGKICIGETGATEHAQKTGHQNFGEAA